jgi:serine/threonine-protein kinase
MSGIPAGAGSLLGKRLGKYEILALLALGGTAEIYLARIGGEAGFEKYVVIKCLHDHLADDADFVKMFIDEARLAAMLDHSNIVQTFELGEHENRYYMVMEFLAGLSLAMVVRRAAERLPGGRIPVPLVLNLAAQASAGLHYAHERSANGKPLNMVHRDISPQNLVVSFEGLVKIVDFGIARADQRDTKTKAGTIKGKFAYMSPEQCVATNVDRRTDVFALGVIVHELLTGERLFKRNSPYDTYQAVLECAVPPPSSLNHDIEPGLDRLVLKACAKDRDQRYPTAEAFGDALLGYLHQQGKGSGPAEVARFVDQYFAQEIDEHGERMREVIGNRDNTVDSGPGWSSDDEDNKANETVELGNETVDLGPRAKVTVLPATDPSLDRLVGRLATNDVDGSPNDEEVPVDRTRIETNPLEAHEPMQPATTAFRAGSTSGPEPLPAPPTVPLNTKPMGGRFSDLANQPTQVADLQTLPPAAYPTPYPADVATPPELATTQFAEDQHAHAAEPGVPRAPVVAGPSPVGRSSAPAGAFSPPQQAVRASQLHNAPSGPFIDPAMSPYPVVSGRPMSSDLAPSSLSPPQRPSFRVEAQPHANPQQAAHMVSPVGDRYPRNVDWDAAAARSTRPVPRWLLAVFFGGAMLIALMITMIVAKIIR